MPANTPARRGVVVGGLSPHPPIIIPEVGGPDIAKARPTVEGVKNLAERLVAANPRTIVVVGPHGPVMRQSFVTIGNLSVTGDLSEFGAPDVSLTMRTDTDLLKAISAAATDAGLAVTDSAERHGRSRSIAGEMDYASLVPLYYLDKARYSGRVLLMSMAYTDLRTCFLFGRLIHQAAAASGIPVGVLASGDLSHRLKRGAPAGYDPRGAEFDRALMDALAANDPSALLEMDPDLIEAAGECGLRPTVIMLGAVTAAGLVPTVLSYEGPFGVGYGVVVFQGPSGSEYSGHRKPAGGDDDEPPAVEHPLVALARQAVEEYVRHGRVVTPPVEPLASGLPAASGAFVSLHRLSNLRGCIGTIGPTRQTLNEEVVNNAISAATEDPRFPPLRQAELADLEISVDVLGEPEPIANRSELDPKQYGVIVQRGPRRGLLLPDLEGVEGVDQQIAIAAQKAGLSPSDPNLQLFRFRVVRYH